MTRRDFLMKWLLYAAVTLLLVLAFIPIFTMLLLSMKSKPMTLLNY